MVEKDGLITEIRTNLQRCGYSHQLREEEYFYEDGIGEHTVPLAGFASPVHDSRTSCICVITCDGVGDVRPEYVNQYRGLGAPVVFVCSDGTVQWWSVRTRGAEHERTISKKQLEGFFESHKEKFAPERIWRAKNLGRLDKDQQLGFVDIGLMPLLEHEMGERLGGLMKRVITLLQEGFTTKQLKEADSQRWIFQAGFWLLCAKILKDKGVRKFARLRIADIDAVLEAVKRHYGSQEEVQIENVKERKALERAADKINKFASLSNLTTEAFGYMYENVLVDKDLRGALGIHATPSYLVDYIIWQLWPWIKEIPEDKRVVLEPACGHAPFLTSAARLLRELIGEMDAQKRHQYLRNRLVGIEKDTFAREVARLSLTLADVPNPNGWQLEVGDVYSGDALSKAAKKSTILLCNPPFQNFTPEEQAFYGRRGSNLHCFNKSGELLWRTLPHMRKGSVFGVILPRGFMHRTDLAQLRKNMASEFELREICELPDIVFACARHESVVLLGRKGVQGGNTKVVRVRPWELKRFREAYDAPSELIPQCRLRHEPNFDFLVPEFEAVWEFCEGLPKLGNVAKVGKGLEYKGKDSLPANAETISTRAFPGSVRGYANFDKKIRLTEKPKLVHMSLSGTVIRRRGLGSRVGVPQVLLNYAPISQEPWRLKALIDGEGRPVTSRFVVIRPKNQQWTLEGLWAILNSPVANAYIYTRGTKRDVLVKLVKQVPVPECGLDSVARLTKLVREYFQSVLPGRKALEPEPDKAEARMRLLAIDAEVMRLYDLPPRLERQVLGLFDGWPRKGVDFDFDAYFPKEFESAIPLHEYLSEEYQRSTVSFVSKWVEEVRSPEIIRALRAAEEAFRED